MRNYEGAVLAFLIVLSGAEAGDAGEGQSSTGLFVVAGTVYRGEVPTDGLVVSVVNGATGHELSDTTGGGGRYAVTFVDLTGNRAAAVGDVIGVEVLDVHGTPLGGTKRTLTSADLAASAVLMDVTLKPVGRSSGDFDGDGVVDFDDFFLFVNHFGLSSDEPGFEPSYDLDGDGVVDFDDFFLFVGNFGK